LGDELMARLADSRPLTAPVVVTLETLGAEPGSLLVRGWQNVSIAVWSGPASAANVSLLDQISGRFKERHPEGMSAVHIVHGQTPLPSSEAREGLVRVSNAYADCLGGVAVVIGGTGFWASTMRSVVTAMRVLSSRAFEMRIHGTVEEVIEWLPAVHHKRTGVKLEASELLAALRQAQAGD
jgi:hypothetical protein